MEKREREADADRPDAPTTEYSANEEPGHGPEEGYVGGGEALDTASGLDPREPPGQG